MNNEDMSEIFEKLNINTDGNGISQDAINNLLNMLNNSSNNSADSSNSSENTYSSESSNSSTIDFETILKMKNIIEKMNKKDDPRSTLLQSLKPYLNENRKSKVDQYIQLMNMSKVMDVFPFFGGDKKNDK